MTTRAISLVVADGSAMFRERFCALLKEQSSVGVVGQAASATDAWALFLRHRPSAVVLDLQLPDDSGLALLRQIKHTDASCVVIVLTNDPDPVFGQECRRYGADHFLHKATEFERAAELLIQLARPQSADGAATNRNLIQNRPQVCGATLGVAAEFSRPALAALIKTPTLNL